jgi:hypothetical protein
MTNPTVIAAALHSTLKIRNFNSFEFLADEVTNIQVLWPGLYTEVLVPTEFTVYPSLFRVYHGLCSCDVEHFINLIFEEYGFTG